MPRQSNGDSLEADDATAGSFDDQSGLGAIKKQYRSELDTLKEFFPDWSDEDLVYALQERNGDLQTTIEDITEGTEDKYDWHNRRANHDSVSQAKYLASLMLRRRQKTSHARKLRTSSILLQTQVPVQHAVVEEVVLRVVAAVVEHVVQREVVVESAVEAVAVLLLQY